MENNINKLHIDILPSGKEPLKDLRRIKDEYELAADNLKGEKALKSKIRELAKFINTGRVENHETALEFTGALESFKKGDSRKIKDLYERLLGENQKRIDIYE